MAFLQPHTLNLTPYPAPVALLADQIGDSYLTVKITIAIWDNSHNAAFIAIKAWSISSVEL